MVDTRVLSLVGHASATSSHAQRTACLLRSVSGVCVRTPAARESSSGGAQKWYRRCGAASLAHTLLSRGRATSTAAQPTASCRTGEAGSCAADRAAAGSASASATTWSWPKTGGGRARTRPKCRRATITCVPPMLSSRHGGHGARARRRVGMGYRHARAVLFTSQPMAAVCPVIPPSVAGAAITSAPSTA